MFLAYTEVFSLKNLTNDRLIVTYKLDKLDNITIYKRAFFFFFKPINFQTRVDMDTRTEMDML